MSKPEVLEGIRVVDLSRVIAGPFATRILRDFGAEVIKIENPQLGDDAREYVRARPNDVPISPIFATLNAGKKSVTLNLKRPEAKEALLKLTDEADVFIHNYRPGVAERLGLSAETLMARNPRLVYCSVSGFGETGPLAHKPGNDITSQAYGGLMGILGMPGQSPIRCPVSIGDLNAGYNAAVGILAALNGRERSGKGSVVKTSLLESVIGMMGQYLTDVMLTHEHIGPMGSSNKFGQPNQAFATKDGFVVIAAVNDAMWRRAAEALGAPDLATAPRFATQPLRVANQTELATTIEALTRQATSDEWVARLDAVGVTCAPIRTIEEVIDDEQTRELDMIGQTTFCGEVVPIVNRQVMIDGSRGTTGTVPRLGEHTTSVLSSLGLPDELITAVTSDNTIENQVGPNHGGILP